MKLFRELGAAAGIVVAILLVLVEWSRLPASIPTHFGWSGQPNGYGSKIMLWLVIALMIFVYGVMRLAQKFPCRFNLPVPREHPERGACEMIAQEMVSWLKLEMMWLLLYVVWAMIRVALSDGPGLRGWFVPFAVVLLGVTMMIFNRKMRLLMGARI
jgi:uncharacterized membrane protein